jgi:hypothetical protein
VIGLSARDNRGAYGLRLTETNPPGTFPIGTPNVYLFGAGLWIGGIGDVDADASRIRSAIGYNPSRTARTSGSRRGGPEPERPALRSRLDRAERPGAVPRRHGRAAGKLFTVFDDRLRGHDLAAVDPAGGRGASALVRVYGAALDTAIVFQWDVLNISGAIRPTGYTIRDMWMGIVLDPDIGEENDDTAAPLAVDGEPILLVWDSDFTESGFVGRPGFMALVPLDNPGSDVNMTAMTGTSRPGVQPVPQLDETQYEALSGLRVPTIHTVLRPAGAVSR